MMNREAKRRSRNQPGICKEGRIKLSSKLEKGKSQKKRKSPLLADYAIFSVVERQGISNADGDSERRPAQDEAEQDQEQHAGNTTTLRHFALLDGVMRLAGAFLQLLFQ